jgi:hypothetical protein
MVSRFMSRISATVLAGLVALALGLGVSGSAASAPTSTPCKVGDRDYPNSNTFHLFIYDAQGAHATMLKCNNGTWEGVTT